MADETIIPHDDNPEWTDEDFTRARQGKDVLPPEFLAGFKRKPGRPKGTMTSTREQVTLRIDRDVLERFRATGPGWQGRINDALRKAVG